MADGDATEHVDNITVVFNRATEHAKHIISQLKPSELLQIYGLYKQATVGACNTPQPRFYEPEKRAKWTAWNNLKNMTCEHAKREYVRLICEFDRSFEPDNPQNDDKNGWAVVSSLLNTDSYLSETDKTIFDYCKEGNLPELRLKVQKNTKLMLERDENGLGLIHWAADRGNLDILKFLVENHADLNAVDNEGQTALHYATSCDYYECAEFLVNAGADCNMCDNDGLKAIDLAADSNILKLLKQFM